MTEVSNRFSGFERSPKKMPVSPKGENNFLSSYRLTGKNKNLSACKPDSVSAVADGYHLSGCNITVTILLPTLQRSLHLCRDRTSRPQTLIYVALQHTRFTQLMHYCKNP